MTSLRSLVRDIPDFPRPGIVFKDLTPVLANAELFRWSINQLVEYFEGHKIDKVVGVEARGFIFAAPVAVALGAGLIPARKTGKLPWDVHSVSYDLEYGTETLELHRDAIGEGERVAVVDDVLATGGTAAAAVSLVERLGGEVCGCGFVLELLSLNGREKLTGQNVYSLIEI